METLVKTDNYEISLHSAMKRFCSYDMAVLSQRPGVTDGGEYLKTRLFGANACICKKTGQITLDGKKADFCEALSVFDWLCDRKENAKASAEFCPVNSLPGIMVRGSGLNMQSPALAEKIDENPELYQKALLKMGGKLVEAGDIGGQIEIFPGLPMRLKFYFGDDEFQPSLTFLWDQNILQFVRYETVYYIAACLQKQLRAEMERKEWII